MSNAALLYRYGFTEPNNQFDIVNLDLDLIKEAVFSLSNDTKTSGNISRTFRQCQRLLEKIGFSPSKSREVSYFEIDSSGKPQIDLLLLLKLVSLSTSELDSFFIFSTSLEFGEESNIKKIASYFIEIQRNIRSTKRRPSKAKGMELDVFGPKETIFLSSKVVNFLLIALQKRENLYQPKTSLWDDKVRLMKKSLKNSEYHALSLRIYEREILSRCRNWLGLLESELGT